MAAARRKKTARRGTRTNERAGPWSEMRHAIANCADTPPQFVMTLEVVVRADENIEEMDRALDDIRCYGAASILTCEALPAGDERRL